MLDIKFDLPHFTLAQARQLAHDLYNLSGSIHPLPSERDQNFYLQTESGDQYVLKIANPAEPFESLDLQNQTLGRLAVSAPHLALPRVITSVSGQTITPITNTDGQTNLVRLFTFVPGKLWAECNPRTPELFRSLGEVMGTIDRGLEGFAHEAAHRQLKWDLAHADWIRDYIQYISDSTQSALVEGYLKHFETEFKPKLARLRTSIIYNDANDYNILISPGDPRQRRVIGVIDFGDLVHSYTIGELAIACTYAMMGQPDPLTAAAQIVAGYHAIYPLTELELEVLLPLIRLRLCVSVTNSAYQRVVEPDNAYLSISEQPAWALLDQLSTLPESLAHYTFRAACGLPPCPTTAAVTDWLTANRDTFSPIIKPELSHAVIFDLSVGSLELGTNADFEEPMTLSDQLNNQLLRQNATVGIGRYNEARPFYASDAYKVASNTGPEWSTIHLGLDIFVPHGTPVYAPLSGVIHLVESDSPTPTLILRHTLENGVNFYTLYRHLIAESLEGWQPGMEVYSDTCLGGVGGSSNVIPSHLHFQIITDLMGLDSRFPGLARPSQHPVWMSLSPDPTLLVGRPPATTDRVEWEAADILASRRQHLGHNLSISYQQPLHIVRGYKQYLFEVNGRKYLDAVNNVPHVGHSHPQVVRAAQTQTAVLNTNTRYLHTNIVRYAERLLAKFPDPLRVVYFVCSGSEANELALRLARTYTGNKETIVLDLAYHGNTQSLIEVSPYKYERTGGAGRQPFIHKVAIPDIYRGQHNDSQAGAKYAREVAEAVKRIDQAPTFMHESLMGSAGQIPLAAGYLAQAYAAVRATGGVCLADEVQVGMGRVGSQFWGFQLQGVVPDIVTIGKPIGNGHPLGAVVTTSTIANAFNNGMEYFNTFGGNPVSCAIGLAVLDVIEVEGLQAHALEVGEYFLNDLRDLKSRHPLIGDVRGAGLFLGVEFVKDHETLERALDEASYVVNRMRDYGILISTDFNTLKIKPPMPFNQADADFFVETLDKILGEDFLKR